MRKRSIAIALALMMIGVLIAGPGIRSVNAQTGEILTAAVVQGDCTQPGAPVAQLRELQPGAQSIAGTPVSTSFTTIDLGLPDLAAGGYAITVSSGTGIVACGEMVAPTGNDMFVGIREANTSGYSGTAWLHARDAQTQVSLFIAQGLGGGAGTDGPPGPPEPPVEPTPAGPPPPSEPTPAGPGPDPTPQAPASGTTYTSPSYGYSLTYDATWQVEEESSEPGQNGPVDYLALTNGLSFLEILGVPTGQPISALDCRTFWENNWRENAQISNLVPRAGADGAPIQGGDASFAYSAFDFDFTPQGGQPIQLAVWIGCYQIPGQPTVITVLDQIPQRAFDQQLPALEAILATIQLP